MTIRYLVKFLFQSTFCTNSSLLPFCFPSDGAAFPVMELLSQWWNCFPSGAFPVVELLSQWWNCFPSGGTAFPVMELLSQ